MPRVSRVALFSFALGLVACNELPEGEPCYGGKLMGPWTAVQIPQLGGTVCSESSERGIRVRHPSTNVAAHRDAYVAAFAAAGWSEVHVGTDNAAEFAADFSRPGDTKQLTVTIERRKGLVEIYGNLSGEGWPKPPPEPGSVQEAMEKSLEKQQRDIQRAAERNKGR